jgi:hypothetical protein
MHRLALPREKRRANNEIGLLACCSGCYTNLLFLGITNLALFVVRGQGIPTHENSLKLNCSRASVVDCSKPILRIDSCLRWVQAPLLLLIFLSAKQRRRVCLLMIGFKPGITGDGAQRSHGCIC